ncbi:MAG: hypothetical protein KAI99_10065, partial [Cyclobacteriaceae bacterium]|nr:hypothetical protein [Cyclobacteriaceae bacterium]
SFGDQLSSGIVSLIDISGNEKLLFTEESGVIKITDNNLEPSEFQLNDLFPSLQIEEVIHYQDLKLFGIATKDKGILFINYEGEIVKSLGTNQGLTSNTCYSLFRDKNDELWACLDIGFARIEYPSALSYFDYSNALNGVVNSVVEHEKLLYVGTTSGLYILNEENQFHKTSIKSEVWDLKLIDGIIWVAASSGIYQIDDRKIKIVEDINARAIAPSGNKDRLWVGTSNGIGSIVNGNGSWIWQEKIKGIDHEIRTIAVEFDSILWGSFEKVSRIVFNSDLSEIVTIETMDEKNGFSDEFYIIESYKLRNNILFGTGLGLFNYDLNKKRFVPDASFGARFNDSEHDAWALAEDADHNIWLSSNGTIGKLIFENDQVQSWDTLAFARLKSTDVWRIVPIKEKKIIYFCTTDGLFRFDQNVSKNYNIPYPTLINKIEINQDSVISYLEIDNSDKNAVLSYPFNFNDLRFSFTATTYNYNENIQFSYMLKGYDDDWSAWKTESIKEYTNLSHGDYTFQVKA